jgi:hypothetical protein
VRHIGGFNFFDLESGLQFGTDEMSLPDEEVRARYSEDFLRLREEARRFHTEGRRDFLRKRTDMPLGEYLDRGGYSGIRDPAVRGGLVGPGGTGLGDARHNGDRLLHGARRGRSRS